jgi:hypothetical protein
MPSRSPGPGGPALPSYYDGWPATATAAAPGAAPPGRPAAEPDARVLSWPAPPSAAGPYWLAPAPPPPSAISDYTPPLVLLLTLALVVVARVALVRGWLRRRRPAVPRRGFEVVAPNRPTDRPPSVAGR